MSDLGSKASELVVPVGDGGEGSADEEGARNTHVDHVRHHGHALHRLPQTHLIGQDPVHAILVQGLQHNHTPDPIHTVLILHTGSTKQS